MKIRSVGAQLFHADGRTDRRDEANSWLFATSRTRLKMTQKITVRSLKASTHIILRWWSNTWERTR